MGALRTLPVKHTMEIEASSLGRGTAAPSSKPPSSSRSTFFLPSTSSYSSLLFSWCSSVRQRMRSSTSSPSLAS